MDPPSPIEPRRSTLLSNTSDDPDTPTGTGSASIDINIEVSPPLLQPGERTPTSSLRRVGGGKLKAEISDEQDDEPEPKRFIAKIPRWQLPSSLQWIPANWTWAKLKPVIRCAVAAWISVVIFLVPSVQKWMGQASFVILIASFLSPPAEPFMVVLERELMILAFSTAAWGWSCLGILFAYLARDNKKFNVSLLEAITGKYLETGPTVIISVFIFLGTSSLLYLRVRQGPGPWTFACVLACLTMEIPLTTAVLFPFPDYMLGRSLVLPFTFHSAISLVCSILIFPQSVSSQYTQRLQAVLVPLSSALDMHRTILKTPPDSTEFSSLSSTINETIGKAEDALIPLTASTRLLKSDLTYSRFSPTDFEPLKDGSARLIGRASGMCMFFSLIDPTRERMSMTPAPSLPDSSPRTATTPRPPSSAGGSRQQLDQGGKDETMTSTSSYEPSSVGHDPAGRRRGHRSRSPSIIPTRGPPSSPQSTIHLHPPPNSRPHSRPHSHTHSHMNRVHLHQLHHALLHMKRSSMNEHAVGTFEVQKYLNLEATKFHTPYSELYNRQMVELLQGSCDDLLAVSCDSIMACREWLGTTTKHRFHFWIPEVNRMSEQARRVEHLRQVRDRLSVQLEVFRDEKRHAVLEPYRQAFEPKPHDIENAQSVPPHRYLFHCYVYQYHLMQFAEYAIKLLDHFISLEETRQKERIWTPVQHFFRWREHAISEHIEKDDEENPDLVQGMEFDESMSPQYRDPDALPPKNILELIMSYVYFAIASLFDGNVLYAIKAGVLTVLLCIPGFVPSSAEFAYRNRSVWAIFMGQLSLSRFRGDTAFALVARIIATFSGGVIGMVMWYISAGGGTDGNVYGLAAVFAVCFPFFLYARLYWPINPLTGIITIITTILVVGYSWQDVEMPLPNAAGVGYTVAWRRFLLVIVGVTAAYIASFLPPSTTIRKYYRRLVSTTCAELGSIYCQIISFANSRRQMEVPEIVTNLLAVRRKLRKAQAIRQNIRYEFSFRGKWPTRRYLLILDTQLQIAYALSHLLSITEQLESAWSRAFLRRTRFNDTDFQGDILAVLTMVSTALRTAQPLPQITPCPLIDRFMLRFQGLEAIHKEFHDDYGLPRKLTLDTLKNEQYMAFCVGVSTAFSIMTRLDRLMVATKELVGEQYYIYGLAAGGHEGVDMGSRTQSIQIRVPSSVV